MSWFTRRTVVFALRTVALLSIPAVAMATQDRAAGLGDRAPRFLASVSPKPIPVDVARMPVLQRRIALDLHGAMLAQALQAIGDSSGLRIAYSRLTVPVDRPVYLQAKNITVAAALTEMLLGLDIDAVFGRRGQVMLVRRGEVRLAVSGAIVGRVTDAKTGEGIAGSEVFPNGTNWKTTTDSLGRYRLVDVDTGSYTLVARRLGYARQSRMVTVQEGQTATGDFALEPVATRLDEVVTTATGPKRRLELGNDIATINVDSIVQTEPITSVTDLLEHRVPGLTVQRTSGAPGDPARIRLRGIGSPLLNNDPLIIVDGVRTNYNQSSGRSANLAQIGSTPATGNSLGNDTASASRNSKSFATPSPLDYLDPNSIEKIEVLKGPSAATLYGQDAANGVIVITTKRGQTGPTRWNTSFNYDQTRMEGNFPDMLLRWGHPANRSEPVGQCVAGNWESYPTPAGSGVTASCVPDSLIHFQYLNDPALTVLGRGHRAQGTLTASGGSSALTYSVTGSYQDQQGLPKLPSYEADRYQSRVGTAPPDWMTRPQHLKYWSASASVTARLSAKTQLHFTSLLSRTDQQRSSMEQQLGSLMTLYLDKASGIYYASCTTCFPGGLATLGVTDSLLTNYFTQASDQATQLTNSASLDWPATDWFKVQANLGLNLQNRADEIYLPWGAATGLDSSGIFNTGHGTAVTTTLDVRGNVPEVRLFGGVRGVKFRFATGIGYANTSIRDQSIQTAILPEGTKALGGQKNSQAFRASDIGTFRWFAEPAIGFRDFWFTSQLQLHQAGTTDGAATRRFWENLKQQLRFPPTFNTSYVLSDAPFFPFKDLFQTFRVRMAFGRSVRQPGITQRLRLYSATGSYWTDGGYANSVYLSTLGNPDLRPERSNEFEAGFDADLLNYALSVSLTGYRQKTDDMIMNLEIPPSVNGGGTLATNIGNTRKTGVELQATVNLLRNGPVAWSATLGYTKSRNLLVALAPGRDPFYTSGDSIQGGIRIAPGYPLGGRWVRPVVAYADVNGDGVLSAAEIVRSDTALFVGETTPNQSANFGTTLSFLHGRVQVRATVAYDGGVSQVDSVFALYRHLSIGLNDPANATLFDQLRAIDNTSSTLIQTVSTYRLQDMSILYQMPRSLTQRLGAQNLTIALQGTNLGLWTNYTGLDPNVNAFSTGGDVRDTGVLPLPRTWSVRINASY